jgi:tetratricopeptide (TPR) repeat protein
MAGGFMNGDIPAKARELYEDAVRILQEDMAHRRTFRGTEVVIENLVEAVKEYDGFFEAWRLLGEVYLGTEQALKGYLALKKAYGIKNDDVGVATLLGEAALTLQRPDLALKYLETARSGEETPVTAVKLYALALARQEKWEEALRAFGEALAEDPSDADIRMECAKVLSELGYKQEAASVLADYLDPYRDIIDKTPAMADTGWIMPVGTVLDRLSPGAKKRAAHKETVPRPENYNAWYDLGNCFLDSELWEAAVAAYKRSLRVHPDYYDALHNMGIALEELGRTDDALQMYEAAIEASPDTPEAYLSVAELLEETEPDETDDIALNYLMYYRLDPDAEGFEDLEGELREMLRESPDISLNLLLAHVYLLREEIDKADEILRQIESAGGGEATLQWVRGRILREQGKASEAEAAFRRGLESVEMEESEVPLDEENLEAMLRNDLAELLESEGRRDEALEVLEEDIEILDADGLSLLAELLEDKDADAARQMWMKALNIDLTHPDSLVGLAERMLAEGNIEGGIVLLVSALKEDPEDEEIIEKLRKLYPEIGALELSPQ